MPMKCEAALMQIGFRCPACDHDGHCVLHSKTGLSSSRQADTGARLHHRDDGRLVEKPSQRQTGTFGLL